MYYILYIYIYYAKYLTRNSNCQIKDQTFERNSILSRFILGVIK